MEDAPERLAAETQRTQRKASEDEWDHQPLSFD